MSASMGRPTLAHPAPGREWRHVVLALLALVLAACSSSTNMGNLFSDDPQAPPKIGQNETKVALLLPLSATTDTRAVATALKQAAEQALIDSGNPGITLIAKDTAGTPAGAAAAAQAALNEGAELILGPLLSTEVQAVSPVARARGVNVIAFSSVSSVAGSGTYLLAFLPEEEVSSIVRYAADKGLRNVAALYPQTQYGAKVEQAMARVAPASGAAVQVTERYPRDPSGIATAASKLGAEISGKGVQALLMPEGGETLRALGTSLEQNGITAKSVKVLGTGLWYDASTASIPIAQGGWYAGVAPELIGKFESRYSSNYGAKPPPIASLAYDAVNVAILLKKSSGGFSGQAITNPAGFRGQNGLFRFRQNGLVERALSILEMTASGPRVLEPAPERFGAGS